MPTDLILGPPGTGKTTTLIDMLRPYAPGDVALVSFTNAAANEAIKRLDGEAYPHVRTIHSLAFRALKLTKGDVVDRGALAAFSEECDEPLTLTREPGVHAKTPGDAYLWAVDFARATESSVEAVWAEHDEHLPGTSLDGCLTFAERYCAFKLAARLYDFNDILHEYALRGPALPLAFAAIDEAQDLTRLQWRAVRTAFASTTRVVVAGDDDQAIYAWAGADMETFLSLNAASTQILGQSHRLPRRVHAEAERQARKITRRYVKTFMPRDAFGMVMDHASLDTVPLGGDDVLVLARNDYLLDSVEERLRREGISYVRDDRPSVIASDVETIKAWLRREPEISGATVKAFAKALGSTPPSVPRHAMMPAHAPYDVPWEHAFTGWSLARRQYYQAVLASGRKLSAPPTVRLSTIHAAKGAEAHTVVLLTDVSTRTAQHLDTDDEHRVWYVALTRAIDTLHIVAPTRGRGYVV
jgi:superfamily I DNA/RNA helicase